MAGSRILRKKEKINITAGWLRDGRSASITAKKMKCGKMHFIFFAARLDAGQAIRLYH